MKIAIVTDYHNQTGVGSQNYNLYLEFRKMGLDADIIHLVSPQGFKKVPSYGINIISSVGSNAHLSFGWGVFHKFPTSLRKLVKKEKYDVVILGHQGLAYLSKALKRVDTKVMIVVDDLFPLYEYAKGFEIFLYKKFLLANLDAIKNIVFISDFTKNDYTRYYGDLDHKTWRTIHIGVDDVQVSKQTEQAMIARLSLEGKRVILNVGSEDPRKNIQMFLEVAKHYKKDKELVFIRVGRKSAASDAYIAEHQLTNIRYVSGLSEEELMALYKVSYIVLSPALLEGYGKQIFEGYLAHNFLITTKVSDVEAIFKDDKNVCMVNDPGCVEEYVTHIDALRDRTVPFELQTQIQSTKKEAQEYLEFIQGIGAIR